MRLNCFRRLVWVVVKVDGNTLSVCIVIGIVTTLPITQECLANRRHKME